MLAKWVEANGQAQPDVWTPKIKSQSCDEIDNEIEGSVEFTASVDFETLLNGITNEVSFSMPFVEMRMLWELQNKLQSVLNKHVSCPGQTEALMLCLISFTALCFEVKPKQSAADIEGASAQGGGICCITIEEEENAAFNINDCIVSVKAALSPQPVHVDISFSTATGDAGIVVTARLSSGESDARRIFDWELWRDAFNGSLEGIRRGMEKHGFRSPTVFQDKRSIAEGTCDMDTSNSGTGSIMKTWAGWLPWNPSICKYEIMSDGFVLQLKEVGVTSRDILLQRQHYTYNIEVPEQKYEVVPYDAAAGHALQHASMVADDFLRRASESTSFPLDGWNISSEDICGRADSILMSRKKSDTNAALVLYEIAASELGNTHALSKAIEILSGEKHGSEAEKRAVTLLERFYLTDCENSISRGRSKSLGNRFQDKEWVAFVRSQFKILISRAKCSTKAVMSYAAFCILLFNFTTEIALDDGVHVVCKVIVQNLQQNGSLMALQLRRSLMSLIRTDSKELFYLECTVYGNLIQFFSSNMDEKPDSTKRPDNNTEKMKTLQNFARLLSNGAEGVPPDPLRSVDLYTRAINEGADIISMNNLALILENGADGVPPDPLRAVDLYTRAIEEGAYVLSMNNLALILENGADGVPPDPLRAVDLYTRAIEEGAHVLSMRNLAFLLEDGADGVPPDPLRAVDLYTRAIDEGAHVDSMFNLALLLENGAGGVPPDPLRAVDLYTRAIDEGADVDSMMNLASLLQYGAEGVPPDPLRAVDLYTRAIDEAADIDSMNNLAFLLRYGAEGVPPDPLRAVDLYTRAIDQGAHVTSMNNLALLLENGAEGVPPDAVRSANLYTRAIEEHACTDSTHNLAVLYQNGAEGVPPDAVRSVYLYTRAIEEGDRVDSMHHLAVLLQDGAEGVPPDLSRAMLLHTRAIAEGAVTDSMYKLAQLLEGGCSDVHADMPRAIVLYTRASNEGKVLGALMRLASIYRHGADGVQSNIARSAELYKVAIEEHESIEAMYVLGVLFEEGGDGVPRNREQALELYRRSVSLGNHEDAAARLNALQEFHECDG